MPLPARLSDPPFDIVHADCLDLLQGLSAGSIDCITTDPAYSGMNEHLAFGHGRIVGHYQAAGNERWFTEFRDDETRFLAFLEECHRVMAPGGHIYVMFDSFSLLTLGPLMRRVFDVKNVIVWDKVNLGMGHYFRRRHELIIFATKGRRKLSRRDLPDVWSVKRIHRGVYPTQKPVELFGRMLEGSVEPGMTVCDPFMGSGSAAIAAIRAGCAAVGADISADAVAVSTERCRVYVETGVDIAERTPRPHPAT